MRLEHRDWLVSASHYLTQVMVEARQLQGKLAPQSIVDLSAIVSEAATTFPRDWASMKCDALLYEINANQPIQAESIRVFRNRLISLLKERNHLCICGNRWESKAMKPTEARPLQKRLDVALASFGMSAEIEDFGTFAILAVKPAKPYDGINPHLLISALQTVQAAVKYNVA